jgi:four helix bundle protein
VQDFRELDDWKKAHTLVLAIYRITEKFPRVEDFGLTIQLRRSASSVAMRIAEGCGRSNNQEFAVDLRGVTASANELEYLLLLAHDLSYIDKADHGRLSDAAVEVRKMVSGLLKRL